MRYLILVRSGPPARTVRDEMVAAGVHIASEALADPSLSRRIPVREGEVTDRLTAFYLIDCPGWTEALEWAARADCEAEVRPVLDMSGSEF